MGDQENILAVMTSVRSGASPRDPNYDYELALMDEIRRLRRYITKLIDAGDGLDLALRPVAERHNPDKFKLDMIKQWREVTEEEE